MNRFSVFLINADVNQTQRILIKIHCVNEINIDPDELNLIFETPFKMNTKIANFFLKFYNMKFPHS